MDPWQRRRHLEPLIMELFGGVVAERRVSRRRIWIGASNDLDRAVDLLGYLATSERTAQKLSDYLWAATEDLVAREWAAIVALAEELLARRSLSGRDVAAFLRSRVDSATAR